MSEDFESQDLQRAKELEARATEHALTKYDDDLGETRDVDLFTVRERRFVEAFTGPDAFGNAAAAARMAGYRNGASDGWRLQQRPHIARAISQALTNLTTAKDWAESEVRAIAGGNMQHFLDIIPVKDEKTGEQKKDSEGNLVYTAEPNWKKVMDAGALRFLEEIEWYPDGRVKKFKTGRTKALEIVLRMEGKLKDGGGSGADGRPLKLEIDLNLSMKRFPGMEVTPDEAQRTLPAD